MSLSQILNTDPPPSTAPGPSRPPHSWDDLGDDNPLYRYTSPFSPPPSSSGPYYPPNDWHDDASSWNRYRHTQVSNRPRDYSEHAASSDDQRDDTAAWKRKRRNTHDDPDYQPANSKRVCVSRSAVLYIELCS